MHHLKSIHVYFWGIINTIKRSKKCIFITRTPFFSLNLQLLQNVFSLFFISFITLSWNSTYFNLQGWIFPFFHYLINFSFIIYAYYILLIFHCLIIIFIWPFHLLQLFYKAKRWKKIKKQMQCVVVMWW